MLQALLVLILPVISISWLQAQTTPNQVPVQQAAASAVEAGSVKTALNSSLPLTETVITIPGICDSKTADSSSCVTVITREQFENLLNGLSQAGQALRPDQTKALAQAYADVLAYAAAARKAGIEDSPQFKEFMNYQHLRVLAGVYRHVLEEKYKSPSPEDISSYYHEHTADFEEVNLRRLMVPKNNPSAKDKEEYKTKALQLARDLQQRAAQGEDFDDLEKEAYKTLGLAIGAPGTQMGKQRRENFVPEEAEEIFALKSGEASKLEIENSSYVVYKVDSKRTLPIDQVKDDIGKLLYKQNVNNAFNSITGSLSPELNPKYFVEPAKPSAANSMETKPPSSESTKARH
jgi:hypothetical protein